MHTHTSQSGHLLIYFQNDFIVHVCHISYSKLMGLEVVYHVTSVMASPVSLICKFTTEWKGTQIGANRNVFGAVYYFVCTHSVCLISAPPPSENTKRKYAQKSSLYSIVHIKTWLPLVINNTSEDWRPPKYKLKAYCSDVLLYRSARKYTTCTIVWRVICHDIKAVWW